MFFYGNTIFHFDGNCGGSRYEKRMFDEIPEKDLMSWNTVMNVFFVNGCWAKVFDLFEDMRLRSRFKPNIVSIVSVLPMCVDVENEGIVGWTWSFWLNRNQDSSKSCVKYTRKVPMYVEGSQCFTIAHLP